MKRIIYIAIIGLISILFLIPLLQSCSNEEESVIFTNDERTKINQYSVLGEAHNDIMNQVLKDLQSSVKLRSTHPARVTKENFVETVRIRTKSALKETFKYDEQLFDFDKFYNVNIGMQTRSSKIEQSYADSIIDNMASSRLKMLVRELIDVSNDNTLSILEHRKKVEKLNKTAFERLSEDELVYFLAGSSTACASYEYWHNNIQDWVDVMGVNSDQPVIRLRSFAEFLHPHNGGVVNGMIGADVGGAVAGCITGALAAGVGATPGAIVGGCAASTGKVVENIWNYFW